MSDDVPGAVHVFTYGSLMFASVWQQVVRGRYRARPARLDQHARLIVTGETYPGLVAQSGSHIDGMLYLDLQPGDLAALDRFEGAEYRRVGVTVQVDGRPLSAQTYLYRDPRQLSAQPWLPETFPLQQFMQRHCRRS